MSNQQAGILRIKIDVTKIDKAKLFRGQKGTYLDVACLMHAEPDQYGNDAMVVQDLGKEAREAGEKGPILGNAKWAVRPDGQQQHPAPVTRHPDGSTSAIDSQDDDGDDIPF